MLHSLSNRKVRENAVDDFVNTDARKISWSRYLKQKLVRGTILAFEDGFLIQSLYQPFTRQWLYYNRSLNERVCQIPRIFPMEEAVENRMIQVSEAGERVDFSVLMTKDLPNSDALGKGQCFQGTFMKILHLMQRKPRQLAYNDVML